jgi:hypothetical protein
MGLIFKLEESSFAGYIDEGTQCLAQIVDIKLQEKPFKDKVTNEPVRRVNFRFRLITDDEHDGTTVFGDTSTTFNTHPECRLRAWSEAVLGRQLPANFELDTDMLLDQRCRVVIGKREFEKEGRTETRNFVASVNPTRENQAALAAAYEEPF